jgi:hypothetical protein
MNKNQLQAILAQLPEGADVYVRVGATEAWTCTTTILDGVLYVGADPEGSHRVYPGDVAAPAEAGTMVDVKAEVGQQVRVRKGGDVYEVLEDLDDRAVLRCVEGGQVGEVVTVAKKGGLLLGHYWVVSSGS